jgi:hypothetical protein
MTFTSNRLLDEICRQLPEIDIDWSWIFLPKNQERLKHHDKANFPGAIMELHVENALDTIRDFFGYDKQIATPKLPLIRSGYELQRCKYTVQCLFQPVVVNGNRSRGSPIAEIDDMRFVDGLPVVFETKLSGSRYSTPEKRLANHAFNIHKHLRMMYNPAGYCAVTDMSRQRVIELERLGAKQVHLPFSKEEFAREAYERAKKLLDPKARVFNKPVSERV